MTAASARPTSGWAGINHPAGSISASIHSTGPASGCVSTLRHSGHGHRPVAVVAQNGAACAAGTNSSIDTIVAVTSMVLKNSRPVASVVVPRATNATAQAMKNPPSPSASPNRRDVGATEPRESRQRGQLHRGNDQRVDGYS